MFDNLEERVINIKDSTQFYLEKQIDYTKLKVFYHVTNSTSKIVKLLSIGVFSLIGLIFLSVALSIGLNQWMNHAYAGYLITGAIYFVLAIIFYTLRDKIERKIVEKFSKSFFNHEE